MRKLLLFLFSLSLLLIFSGKDLSSFIDGDEYKVTKCHDRIIESETIEINGEVDIEELFDELYVVYSFNENLEDIEIIYAYSPVLRGVEFVDKKPVNLQITISKDVVTLSNPINIGSF